MVTRCGKADCTKEAKLLLGERYCSICRSCNISVSLEPKDVGNESCFKGEVWWGQRKGRVKDRL